MKSSNEIFLLKLGGSLLTDKNIPFSIREEIVKSAIQQIIDANKKLILIHGGGSFGHPIAKKYNISQGINISIKNQIFGLTKTHEAMVKFNSQIIEEFLEKKYPALSIQPSSIFIKRLNEISFESIELIETSLDLGILPVLYGDIILDKEGNFSIISGDRIILELCKNLNKYSISKVIFAIEKDGIFVEDIENDKKIIKLALEISLDELDKIKLADLGNKIDVTGSIRGKIHAIKEICRLNIPVQVINGLTDGNIFKALSNQKLICTNISGIHDEKRLSEIYMRKLEHLKIPIISNVQHIKNYFDNIKLIHHSLPEVELDDIDIATMFFNKKISAPICISAITGGHPISKAINRILAKAAEEENIIMSVGSQRIGLEDPSTRESFEIVREVAPNIPIIGNIGIGQINSSTFKKEDFIECIEMVKADVMAIHFNALHELVQSNGNISYKNFFEKFQKIRKEINIPIIAKEVGTGFNKDLALSLDSIGFDGFDVGGTGGTSFAAIESHRDNFSFEKYTRRLADSFREWGIPTPLTILYVRKVSKKLIIATGGLRNGIDIAKSISLGADIGGFAYKFLLSAWKDYKNNTFIHTIKEIKTLKDELRSSLWLTNITNVENLKDNKDKRVLLGELYQWLNQ